MFGDTPLLLIETPEALAEAADKLSRAPVIGVDTEADSFHHYQEKVCLLQISDLDNDYVIDPLAVHDLSPLAPIMDNPDQVKIFHGADYDVVSLKRDFGFRFRNIFDTMVASQFAGLPRVGLADLIRQWFGHEVDKKYQRHDWAERPLRDEHLFYARGDTHFLPALRDVLRLRLQRLGRLEFVMEECRVLEEREWRGRTRDPADFWRVKGAKQLDEAGLKALRALYAWREQEGASLDRPVFKVVPDEVLLELAESRPADLDTLIRSMRRGSGLARRFGPGMVAVLQTAATDETPIAPPTPKEAREPGGLRARDQERVMTRLKEWRNMVVQRQGLPSVAVVPNGVLTQIARVGPRTMEELAAVPELRRWQLQEFGQQILDEVLAMLGPAKAQRAEGEASGATSGDASGDEDAGAKRRRRRRRPRKDEGDGSGDGAGSGDGSGDGAGSGGGSGDAGTDG